ncbi:MAG TPA: acyl-CoA dehydrogenase family protein [Candidatus Margulisiibacteriota bacterium]|nr:acyl-CoA dehydrogenase family protein [Candidatus Margulisiibacteriota bacterium]
MDLMPTPEQDAIRDSVRTFLETELPMSQVRTLLGAPTAAYAELWRRAAALGFFALGLPEALGGAGYALTEEMVLFEELGRALAPGPWLGTVLAAHALARGGAEARGPLAAVVAGELRAAACIDPWGGPLERRGDRVSGTRRAVLGAGLAEGFVVVDDAAVLFVPRGDAVAVQAVPSLDATNPIGTVAFHDASCLVVGRDVASAAALRRAAAVLSCADAVGGIARTVEMSVAYAKVRHQFGKPIGSFQAVKHRCADMAVRAEVARSATTYATVSVRDGAVDADFQAAVAKVLAADAYLRNSADNVQNHGGMGFTWECDAHLYVKRARAFDATLGSRRTQLDALVARLRSA